MKKITGSTTLMLGIGMSLAAIAILAYDKVAASDDNKSLTPKGSSGTGSVAFVAYAGIVAIAYALITTEQVRMIKG